MWPDRNKTRLVFLETCVKEISGGLSMICFPQFDKKYSYGIRYNYGKEGKKTDYTPFGCMKIIMNNPPAVGDAHGKTLII